MKKILLAMTAIVLSVASCQKEQSDQTVDDLGGVWEGPMTTDADQISVKILDIEGSNADFYDMDYTSDGYIVKDKQSSPVDLPKKKKKEPSKFTASLDGAEVTFYHEGNTIYTSDGEDVYVLTGNEMSHYDSLVKGLNILPTDSEFTGPKSLDSSILDNQTFRGYLQSESSLYTGMDWLEFLEWAAKTAATASVGRATTEILNMIFNTEGSTTLDDLMNKMDEICDQLTAMTKLFHNIAYEDKLNERMKYVTDLTNYNSEYFIRLGNAKNADEIKTIVLDWASHSVDGNPVYVQGLNFIGFLLGTVVEQRDIYNVYDLYTYNTTPWENMGYEIRETLRKSDIAVASQNMFLTQLYHLVRTDLDDASREQIIQKNAKTFNDFCAYIKARPVEHHDDYAVCQIDGAHFVMDAKNFDYPYYKNPSWCTIPCRWTRYKSDDYFMWGSNQAENYAKALKPAEMKAILDFYKGTKDVYEILTEDAKCNLDSKMHDMGEGYNGIIALQSGYYSADWSYIGIDSAISVYSTSSTDIQRKSVGVAVIDGAGWFAQYLEFYRWKSFDDNAVWVRVNVTER